MQYGNRSHAGGGVNTGSAYAPARADGCHPVDGCQDGTPFFGSVFQYLAANVDRQEHGQPAAAAVPDREHVDRREDRVHRRDARGHAARRHAVRRRRARLPRRGRHGQRARADPEARRRRDDRAAPAPGRLPERAASRRAASRTSNACENFSGPDLVDVVNRLDPEIDVVVSAHTHAPYICTIDSRLVTSASSFGRLITTIDLTLDRRTGEMVSATADNNIVTQTVAKDPATTALLARYKTLADPIANRVIGTITGRPAVGTRHAERPRSPRRAADGRRDRGRPARGDEGRATSAARSSRS